MDRKTYQEMVDRISPPSKKKRNFILAYLVGGLICIFGQLLRDLFLNMKFNEEQTGMIVASIIVFITVLLTGLRIFEKIAKHAGAGTLVPLTGFANSVAAPAIEFKSEGFVLGVGANMFKIAGPVIVYGTAASVVYGLIYWIFQML